MPNSHLYLESGEDIGVFRTSEWSWSIGDALVTEDRTRFRNVDIVTNLDLGVEEFSPFSGLFDRHSYRTSGNRR